MALQQRIVSNPSRRTQHISGESAKAGRTGLLFCITCVVAAAYVWLLLPRGWIPHDEGALAQSAERVLRGEIPHRDFAELYTGGLSFINAIAFKLFGMRLLSLRLMLYGAFLLWLPLVFWIASRFASPLGASVATLISVVWSLPNYSAAVPSWYNLFLATAGIACFFRYLDTRGNLWLVLAGIAGGVSCLFKIVGVYYVAAGFMFLVFVEQTSNEAPQLKTRAPDRRYSWLVGLLLVAFVGGLVGLLHRNLGFDEFLTFVVPGVAIAGLIATVEVWESGGLLGERLRRLARLWVPFMAGVTIPLAGFALFYLLNGSFVELWTGIAVTPFRRLSFAASRPDLSFGMLPSAAIVAVVVFWAGSSSRKAVVGTLAVGGVLLGVLLEGKHLRPYLLGWESMNHAIPVLTLWGALVVARRRPDFLRRRQQLMLLVASLGLCSLVSFPFAAPIYSMYVLPLAVLTFLGIIGSYPALPISLLATLALFYLAFPVLYVTPGFLQNIGYQYAPDAQRVPLKLARTGLRVDSSSSEEYRSLVAEIRAHANGRFIYATPDCPEVYFLSDLRNPTKTLFEFLDPPEGRVPRVMAQIRAAGVKVVVVNQGPKFSGRIPGHLRDSLRLSYPASKTMGRFVVRWRQ
jgi:hypothetical protein